MQIDLSHPLPAFALTINAELPATGITVIAGPSGAGKTSLLRCLAGFKRGKGLIQFGKRLLQDNTTFVLPEQRQFGYVSQRSSLFPHLSVRKNLDFAQKYARPDGPEFLDICARMGIDPLLKRLPETLSGGEAARVGLARALLANPVCLLLDEPFAALDEEAKAELAGVLQAAIAAAKLPTLLVAHEFSTLTRMADHVVYLQKGAVLAHGPLAEILISDALPFAARNDACAVIHAKITGDEGKYDLTQLQFGGHLISVPKLDQSKGCEVRLRVRAGDVSIAREAQSQSSIINSLPVTVREIRTGNEHAGQALLLLETGGETLLARLTTKSVAELAIQVGDQVYARIKASAANRV
jgi:molybdate transport system ATP-binding protein